MIQLKALGAGLAIGLVIGWAYTLLHPDTTIHSSEPVRLQSVLK